MPCVIFLSVLRSFFSLFVHTIYRADLSAINRHPTVRSPAYESSITDERSLSHLRNKISLFVCLSLTESKEHYRPEYEQRDVMNLSEVIRSGELESEVRLPPVRMVARQPIRTDFVGRGFPGVFRHGELEFAVNLTGL